MPPTTTTTTSMSNSAVRCRTISQHLNDLKKENFSLKLRIYFLEEKIQQKFEHGDDDVHKRVSEAPSCFSGVGPHVHVCACRTCSVCQCVADV